MGRSDMEIVGARKSMTEEKLGLMLVVPAVVLMCIIAAYPILSAFWLSLFRYNIKFPSDKHFVGLSNYTSVLAAPHFHTAVVVTVVFTIISVAIEFTLGMAMALVMNRALGWLTG